MSDAYFSKGEEVILQPSSLEYQHLYGTECTIISKPIYGGEVYKCPHCGEFGILDEPCGEVSYFLDISEDDNCCYPWMQSALRKKHKPGESFDSLMEGIKSSYPITT